MPLQTEWDLFETYRQKIYLISICKWQMGQLQNLLNYFYDPISKRIYLTQATLFEVYDPVIAETTSNFDSVMTESTDINEPVITDVMGSFPMIIHIPVAIHDDTTILNDLIATVEKIKLAGLGYTIETF